MKSDWSKILRFPTILKSNASLRASYSTIIKKDKFTLLSLAEKYAKKIPLTMMTTYDYTSSKFVDTAEIDISLVGDSLGMVMLGQDDSVSVTMDEMIMHCKSVARGSTRSFKVGDMPYGSYEESHQHAIRNAIRFLKEGRMEAVKIEGDADMAETIKCVVKSGVPVMGHIGLTPQRLSSFGGFKVQGRTLEAAKKLLSSALALQDAGCFSIVIEAVPEIVAEYITSNLEIPTIGIGAGKYCSGQVLVYHDILGLYPDLSPKFSKKYLELESSIVSALKEYKREVETREFPSKEHIYKMKADEIQQFEEFIKN